MNPVMDRRALKQAARRALAQNAGLHPGRLTLLVLALGLIPAALAAVQLGLGIFGELSGGGFQSRFSASSLRGMLSCLTLLIYLCDAAVLLLSVGYRALQLHMAAGQPAGIYDLTAGFRRLGQFISLGVQIFVRTFLWSLLFLVPGIIAAYRYSQAVYLLLEHPGWSAWDAIEQSKRLTMGHKKELFLLDLSFLYYYIPLYLASCVAAAGTLEQLAEFPAPYLPVMFYILGQLLVLLVQLWRFCFVSATEAQAYLWLRDL